ncbi:TolC family protein [Aureliella helgolandensis]|uniref:Outer membrane efflux protein n=1 Tax=Aureliella helgolandensis TaxID=2527968 RepID=A0A518G195_9BACT|nr:TolC family protein [Aureliella helgolandensis]QDV22310.1 Outer membrane efflux protein [Aureliella helgolandensis]
MNLFSTSIDGERQCGQKPVRWEPVRWEPVRWEPVRWEHCVLLALALLSGFLTSGCSRTRYRHSADSESYCLIDSRQNDPLWNVPAQTVEPQPASRMYLGAEQDCGPKPQDDAAARQYMNAPDGKKNTKYYGPIPTNPHTENPVWLDYLPRNEEGQIPFTQPLAIDLSLLHSRDYQTQFESVYLTALNLSGNRFEFDTQWFGGTSTSFAATGADLGDQRSLNVVSDRLGLTRNLAGGGQFATSILNSLFWDFGNGGVQGGSAALVTSFTQPLLRGAFRHVRLENLTQSERDLLYAVRDFARFRRTYYVDISTSYLSLLTQVQAIRNSQANVQNLRRNLDEHELLVSLEMVSQIQVDQIFQQYQSGRLSLLSSQQNLAASFDGFKFDLGLPPWIPLEIDESLLAPFELVSPELLQLQTEAQTLYESLVQFLPPSIAPEEVLQAGFLEYEQLRGRVDALLPEVEAELAIWQARLERTAASALQQDDQLDLQQQLTLAQRTQQSLSDLKTLLNARPAFDRGLRETLEQYGQPFTASDVTADGKPRLSLAERITQRTEPLEEADVEGILPREEVDPRIAAWSALQLAVGERLREDISELYVAQTQVRLFLINIDPQAIESESAITFAHQNRLDLMNSKATVMDAFRKVEVAADALESDLSVSGSVALGSDPSKNNPFRFDSSANRYRVGVEFDGPLNRLNERNAYRASQIRYQQASRGYMSDRDRVANEVRSILRQLELSRLNFQIARQQLVAATRQVDQAQIDLRRSTQAESNLTLFLLQALQGMLDSKNNLISNWIQYRVQKMRLFAALEMLYLDENGVWINETTGLKDLADFKQIDTEYFPAHWRHAPIAPNLEALRPTSNPEGFETIDAGTPVAEEAEPFELPLELSGFPEVPPVP